MPGMIDADLAAKLAAFFADLPVQRVELCGSRAKGQAREGSDVDLLVTYSDKAPKGLAYFGFVERLQGGLASLLASPVDVIDRRAVEENLNSIQRDAMLSGARVLYECRR